MSSLSLSRKCLFRTDWQDWEKVLVRVKCHMFTTEPAVSQWSIPKTSPRQAGPVGPLFFPVLRLFLQTLFLAQEDKPRLPTTKTSAPTGTLPPSSAVWTDARSCLLTQSWKPWTDVILCTRNWTLIIVCKRQRCNKENVKLTSQSWGKCHVFLSHVPSYQDRGHISILDNCYILYMRM